MQVVKTVTIRAPTLADYDDLYQQHPQTLSCPCTQISMIYSTFLEINHTLHPVCSSVYVRDEFIRYLSSANSSGLRALDFVKTCSATFQALNTLCRLVADLVSTNREQFYLSNYVASFATTPTLLQSQSASLVQQFIASTTNNILLSLRLIRNMTQANNLLSALFTNYILVKFPFFELVIPTEMTYSDGCSCAFHSSCITNATMFLESADPTDWVLPGFYRGCFIVEALLQSHLGCFFDQACLETFHSRLLSDHTMNTTALDQADLTKFAPNTTVGAILDELMVETWNWSAVYGKYFGACQPKECTYTMTGRNDAIYIVTTVIGLIGGLVTVLKFVVPRLVVLLMRRRETNAGNYLPRSRKNAR